MSEWSLFERDGTRLALADFGGLGQSVLLIHGLAGHAQEWDETASWLSSEHHVFAVDLRGHGRSERQPHDVSLEAMAADTVAAIHRIGESVILGGQSLGGLISILVAAAHPDLVRALVVVEASPHALDDRAADALASEVEGKLSAWPVPFPTKSEAFAYFDGPSASAMAWTNGLEEREDGLWPRFDIDIMIRMIRETVGVSLWAAWENVRCPVLIVRGANGSLSAADTEAMLQTLPAARLVEIPEAAHDVHLDRPDEWRRALTLFLSDVRRAHRL